MAFNRTFANQHVFKRQSKLELVKVVQQKEEEGWSMVKPIYCESLISKDFKTDKERKRWSFSGDNEVIKYVAVMKLPNRSVISNVPIKSSK